MSADGGQTLGMRALGGARGLGGYLWVGAAALLLSGCGSGGHASSSSKPAVTVTVTATVTATATPSASSTALPLNVVFNESDVTDYFKHLGYEVKPTGGGYYNVASPHGVKCEIYALQTGSADQSAYVGDPNYLMDPTGTLGLQYGGLEGNDGDCAAALSVALKGFVPWAQANGVI